MINPRFQVLKLFINFILFNPSNSTRIKKKTIKTMAIATKLGCCLFSLFDAVDG